MKRNKQRKSPLGNAVVWITGLIPIHVTLNFSEILNCIIKTLEQVFRQALKWF